MSSSTTEVESAPAVAGRDRGARRQRRPFRILAAGLVLLAAAALVAGGVAWRNGQLEGGAGAGRLPTSLASVTHQTLSSRVTVDGVLGYAGDHRVVNHAPGIVTWLPGAGDIVGPGEVLYAVDGSPVVLLEGSLPAYRTLTEGVTGPDVAQLNAALVSLGYAGTTELDPQSAEFSAATAAALGRLQAALGVEESGALELGQAVFLPGPARITSVEVALGAPVQRGATMLRATSTQPVVTVALDPALRSRITVGDAVTVTLPGRQTVEGTVTAIANVATAPASGGQGQSGGRPTIRAEVTLADAEAAGALDQAPVSVSITTAVVENALVVPVTALMALAGGGHAVEVAHADGRRELVPVTTGLFDGSLGLVAVSGAGLEAGQQVVVPGVRR